MYQKVLLPNVSLPYIKTLCALTLGMWYSGGKVIDLNTYYHHKSTTKFQSVLFLPEVPSDFRHVLCKPTVQVHKMCAVDSLGTTYTESQTQCQNIV